MSAEKTVVSEGEEVAEIERAMDAALDRLDAATIAAAGFCTKTPDCPYCEARNAAGAVRAAVERLRAATREEAPR